VNRIRPAAGDSVQQLWLKPRCRPPSHQRSSTSSSINYATTRRRSKHAASSPNPGFIGRENTSSLALNSTPRAPTSDCGRRRFRILPTLPLTTRAVSPSVASRSPPPKMRIRVIGSAPSVTSYTCAWIALRWIDKSPSPHSMDYRQPSDRSV
jgi:hypothetical protein